MFPFLEQSLECNRWVFIFLPDPRPIASIIASLRDEIQCQGWSATKKIRFSVRLFFVESAKKEKCVAVGKGATGAFQLDPRK